VILLFNVLRGKMDIPEKRLSKRLKINLPLNFERLGATKYSGETVTKDISVTGIRMNLDAFSPTNTNFLLKIRLPEVNRVIEGMARIVWANRVSYSDRYQAGLQFYEMNSIFRKWLEEYILINETLSR
jgi:hypothetical protein